MSTAPASLKQRVLHAGVWSLGGHALAQAIRLASNLLMTRLLVPEMFGIMAIATMIAVVLSLLSDIGLRQNIVRGPRGDDPLYLDTAWSVGIIRSAVLWLVVLAVAAGLHFAAGAGLLPSKSVYASPELPLVMAFSSFAVVVQGFQSTKIASAHRSFDQKRLVLMELYSQLTALSVMLVLGLATRSIWALVVGGLVGTLTTTLLSHAWLRGHPNRLRWDPEAFRDLRDFGKWVFASSSIYVFASNGDRLLLGAFVEAGVLGLYAIAALIIAAIEAGVVKLFSAVWLPALSEIARSHPSRLREFYYKLCLPGDLLLFFLIGLVFAAGQSVIDLLYDPRYSGAGGMLQVLALSLFTVRYGVAHQMYLALGLPHYLTIINAVRFVALYALVPVLFYWKGMQAALWGIALHTYFTVPFIYAFNTRLKLIDARRELLVLVTLPLGLLAGLVLRLLQP